MKLKRKTFRFQLANSTWHVSVVSSSVKGAIQKLGRTFSDVKQFTLVR